MRRFALTGLTWIAFLAGGFAAAEGQDYTFTTTSGDGDPGDTVTITVSLNIADGATGVRALQFAQCFDASVISLDAADIVELPYLSDLNGGTGPGFGLITVAPDAWAAGVIVDLMDDADLLESSGDLYEATYSLDAPGSTTLAFCGEGLFPPSSLVGIAGTDIITCGDPGYVCVGGTDFQFSLSAPACVADGEAFEVDFVVTDLEDSGVGTQAFSLGLAHDGALFIPTGAEATGVLTALQDGDGPAFFTPNLAPVGGEGVTIDCVYNVTDPSDTVSFDSTGQAIVTLTYEATVVESTATELTFIDTLGVPPVTNELIEGSGTALTPCARGSVIEARTDAADCADVVPEFIRGDADGNGVFAPLIEALFLLEHGFLAGTIPPCLDAADADDDGILCPITDALFALESGFAGGPPPPAPHPDCGTDDTSDALDCDTQPTACP